jgi:hypothetical protein
MKNILLSALFLGVIFPAAAAADSLARFDGGIGVIPVSSGQGTGTTAEVVNRNIVRGVQPAGQIWVIADLRADVDFDGGIKVDGRGLLLGGGNSIGLNGTQSVRATVICGAANSLHDSGLVALAPNGDFSIDGVLSPPLPAVCDAPTLLIRNPAGSWFAAGIPKF